MSIGLNAVAMSKKLRTTSFCNWVPMGQHTLRDTSTPHSPSSTPAPGNLAGRFRPFDGSNARGVAVNQLPTAIPFHPDVGVSDTDMSPFAL